MCGKLPATLALFAVLGLVHPHTIKPFLPSFLSWRPSREKRYQALSCFSVPEATKSWVGPGNKASTTMLAEGMGMRLMHKWLISRSCSTMDTKLTNLFSGKTWVCPFVIVHEHPGLVAGGHVVHLAPLHLQELWHPRCCLLPHIHTFTRYVMHPGGQRLKTLASF